MKKKELLRNAVKYYQSSNDSNFRSFVRSSYRKGGIGVRLNRIEELKEDELEIPSRREGRALRSFDSILINEYKKTVEYKRKKEEKHSVIKELGFSEKEIRELNDIRRRKQIRRASLIKSYFSGRLDRYIVTQINGILRHEFDGLSSFETGGGVYDRKEKLEFRIIKHQFGEIEITLSKLKDGTWSGEDLECLKEYFEKSKTGSKNLKMIYGLIELNNICRKIDKRTILLAHELLCYDFKSRYKLSLKDLGVHRKDFIGSFHVHSNRTPPSKPDLEEYVTEDLLYDYPDLVISADKDYKRSGVDIYLIYCGDFELIYQDRV